MFGFGYFVSSISSERVKKMMKISGVVVIILGLFMLNRGLANFGWGFKELLPSGNVAITKTSNQRKLIIKKCKP
jgi:sulfite exporter TauE/SafE